MENNDFKFVMPAQIQKSDDGEWKVAGLASTEDMDQQGERIIQKGIDLTPVDQKKGYFNFDHMSGPENLIGTIDGYKKGTKGLYVHGRLFKNHDKAKAVQQIMSSLGDDDKGRVGLSVEGKILKRNDQNPKIIEKCQISKVAVTFNPVNQGTYADLVKSMASNAEVEFNSTEDHFNTEKTGDEKVFTASQVVDIVQKALSAGAAGMKAPDARTGGEALSQESLDKDPKKVEKKQGVPKGVDPQKHERCVQDLKDQGHDKESAIRICNDSLRGKIKKKTKKMYKSDLNEIMGKLSVLYPDVPKTDLWVAVQERLMTKFPDINQEFGKGNSESGKNKK